MLGNQMSIGSLDIPDQEFPPSLAHPYFERSSLHEYGRASALQAPQSTGPITHGAPCIRDICSPQIVWQQHLKRRFPSLLHGMRPHRSCLIHVKRRSQRCRVFDLEIGEGKRIELALFLHSVPRDARPQDRFLHSHMGNIRKQRRH